jgi:hypothetical protein
LLNSEFALEQSRRLAGSVLSEYCECEGEDARVRMVYELAFGRVPSSEESAAAVAFIGRQTKTIAEHDDDVNPDLRPIPDPEGGIDPAHAAAYVDLCHALVNSNEFLFVD